MNVKHINPFIMASKSVLGAMINEEIVTGKPCIVPIEFKDNTKVIIIGITGEVKGQVFLGFSQDISCKVISKMLMSEVTEIDVLGESALAELGNMIMGNTATAFYNDAIKIDITTPFVATGNMYFNTTDVENLMVPIEVKNIGIIEMHIAIKKQ